jgi:hypothetical protein
MQSGRYLRTTDEHRMLTGAFSHPSGVIPRQNRGPSGKVYESAAYLPDWRARMHLWLYVNSRLFASIRGSILFFVTSAPLVVNIRRNADC